MQILSSFSPSQARTHSLATVAEEIKISSYSFLRPVDGFKLASTCHSENATIKNGCWFESLSEKDQGNVLCHTIHKIKSEHQFQKLLARTKHLSHNLKEILIGALVRSKWVDSIMDLIQRQSFNQRALTHSALAVAVINGHCDVFRHILEETSYDDETCLQNFIAIAAEKNHTECLSYLHDKCGDIGEWGQRSMSAALSSMSRDTVEMLLAYGVPVLPSWRNAAIAAGFANRPEFLSFALETVDRSQITNISENVVHAAIYGQSDKVLKMLIELGAQIDESTFMMSWITHANWKIRRLILWQCLVNRIS